MRKRIIFAVILGLCLCLASCGKQNKPYGQPGMQPGEEIIEEKDSVCTYSCQTFLTEDYALYHNQHGRLQLFDVTGKSDLVFCFDAGCEHKPAKTSLKGEVIQKGCIAYEFSPNAVMMKDGNCYFLADTGEVYVSDRRGENRRLIAKLPEYITNVSEVFFSQDALFVIYSNSYDMLEVTDFSGNTTWVIGDLMDETTCGIVQVGLSDGSVKEVFRAKQYNALLPVHDVRGSHVYFEYFYLDIPYVGPNLETYGPSGQIPEGLTVENYREFMQKHQWTDVYDYDMSTGELKCLISHRYSRNVGFAKEFFAFSDEEGTDLYRYSGELIRRLDKVVSAGYHTDTGLVCIFADEPAVYNLIDGITCEVTKRVAIPYDEFLPTAFIGKSCYGDVTEPNGSIELGYLSTEDFWSGNTANTVAFSVYEE